MKKPTVHPDAFVAFNATVRGDVRIEEGASIFYGAVLRGDRAPITIGPGSNIQENCVVHVEYDLPVVLGRDVTVGHGAILHGCTVGDETLIGMGAIVLNGAKIGRHCLIGAGALVTQNMVIPDGSLAFGSPAKIRGTLTDEAEKTFRYGQTFSVTDPTRPDYHFIGWYLPEGGQFNAQTVTESMALTARWGAQPVDFTVEHYYMDTTGTMPSAANETDRTSEEVDTDI